MSDPNLTATPGFRTDRTAEFRNVVLSRGVFLPGGRQIDGANSRDPLNTGDLDTLRAGLIMGKITASGSYAPSILGVTTANYTDTGTSLTVSAATATELVRRVGTSGTFSLSGPPAAAGTVATTQVTYSAVNTTTGVITVTDIGADRLAGSILQPEDGSEQMLALINNGSGIKVTDEDNEDQNTQYPLPVIGGLLDTARIVNYPTDSSLQAFVKDELRENSDGFSFDDDFKN